jgi:DNA primase
MANISYVAVAPDGKEVEELAGKEILMSLRKRMTVDEFLRKAGNELGRAEPEGEKVEPKQEQAEFKGDIKEATRTKYGQIKGTKGALLLDGNMDIIKKASVRDIARNLRYSRTRVFAVMVDGTATASIIKACDESNVAHLAATNFASVEGAKVNLISL